jgi:hypothetical protein
MIQTWAKENGAHIDYGRGKRSGSMISDLSHATTHYYLFALRTYSVIEGCFQWLKEKAPFDDRGQKAPAARAPQ